MKKLVLEIKNVMKELISTVAILRGGLFQLFASEQKSNIFIRRTFERTCKCIFH